jgi:peptide/nickel transport system ATP-binding protein
VALAGWAIALLALPGLITDAGGGWLAPAVLLLASRDAVVSELWHRATTGSLLPPTREARGTLSVRSLVVRDDAGLPCTVPLELELRAGDSVAVLSASLGEALALAETIAGRRPPASGEVAVDGTPLTVRDRLVAVVAFGEPFLLGDLEENLAALCDDYPDRQTIGAVIEACGLDEAAAALDGATIAVDGAPLAPIHRLQVAAARVLPSDYRVLVVVDPAPWTDPVRRELWRRAVVRASLGRTAVWFTADRELASRADRVLALTNGTLRRLDSAFEAAP